MIKFWNEYHLPASLEDALELLAQYEGRARVVAGGTDLLLDLPDAYYSGERPHFDALVDVTRIAGAGAIREEDGWIVVGCGVTHTQIVASPIIQKRATALAEACAVVGGPQVRNVATLVGNIAHALPAADGLIASLVLDAQAQVKRQGVSQGKSDWEPIESLYKGPGQSTVDPARELIAAVRVRPTAAGEASAFTRVMRPQGVALPVLGMACRVRVKRETENVKSKTLNVKRNLAEVRIEDVAISAGPVAPTPFRARRTEEFLCGRVLDEETLTQAGTVLLSEVSPRTSPHRATKEYRFELLPSMLRQVLMGAMGRLSD